MLAERLTAQLLAGAPAPDAATVVRRLLAVQAQDPRGARLAIRARSQGVLAADVDRALTEERTLVITWLNRGTLHLVHRDDLPWLQALTTPPQFTTNARRLSQEGVTPAAAERGVAVIARSLAREGPLTRAQLGERLASAGVRSAGQALVHLLMAASLRGLIVRGPMIGRQHAFVLVEDWLGSPGPVARQRALAELARRYLAGHGPASDRDLARWAGLPLRDARSALGAIAATLQRRPDGLLDLADRDAAAALPAPRLLGAFDPVLLGWTSRAALVGANEVVIVANGMFRPFALVRGRAVSTWRVTGGRVALEPFEDLAREDLAALEADGRGVLHYLGLASPPLPARAAAG